MPRFHYKAVDSEGRSQEGTIEAPDRDKAVLFLHDRGQFPLETREVDSGKGFGGQSFFEFNRRASRADIILLLNELSIMVGAGLPLHQSLQTLIRVSSKPTIVHLVETLKSELEGGKSLSAAMASTGSFSALHVNMVRAGESAGVLELALQRLSEYEERAQILRETVRSAMIYPTLLLVLSGISLIVLLTYVVPRFEPLFADLGAAMPLPTQIVITTAKLLRTNWYFLPIIPFGVVMGWRWIVSSPRRRLLVDDLLLRLPLFGALNKKVEVARFTRTLGTLLGNGVPVLSGMNIVREVVQNTVLRQACAHVTDKLAQGRGLASPLADTQLFPALVTQLVQVGEETGQLDTMLLKIASIFDADVERTVKRALSVLEPSLILVLGALIGFIIVSILMAILSLNDFVQ